MSCTRNELGPRYEAWHQAVLQLNRICAKGEVGLPLALACKAVDDTSKALKTKFAAASKNGEYRKELANQLKVSAEEILFLNKHL